MTIIELIINEKNSSLCNNIQKSIKYPSKKSECEVKHTYMSGHAVWFLPHASQLDTCSDHSLCCRANEGLNNCCVKCCVSLPIYRKHLILVSYRYVFLQGVDITGYAVSVDVVFSRLDDAGVPNLAIGAENKTCPSI